MSVSELRHREARSAERLALLRAMGAPSVIVDREEQHLRSLRREVWRARAAAGTRAAGG